MVSQPADSDTPDAGNTKRRMSLLIVILLTVPVCLFLGMAVLIIVLNGNAPETLTRAEFEAARQKWKAQGPSSYNVDVEVRGKQPAKYHVEVRQGEVVAYTRNGLTPRNRGTWETWTIPGQYEMIAHELNAADNPQAVFGVPKDASVWQHAEFDAQLGYPRRYERRVLTTDLWIEWLTTLEVVP